MPAQFHDFNRHIQPVSDEQRMSSAAAAEGLRVIAERLTGRSGGYFAGSAGRWPFPGRSPHQSRLLTTSYQRTRGPARDIEESTCRASNAHSHVAVSSTSGAPLFPRFHHERPWRKVEWIRSGSSAAAVDPEPLFLHVSIARARFRDIGQGQPTGRARRGLDRGRSQAHLSCRENDRSTPTLPRAKDRPKFCGS